MSIIHEEMPLYTRLASWYGSNAMLGHEVGAALGKLDWCGVPMCGGLAEIPHIDARTIVCNDLHRHIINMARVVAHPITGPRLYRRLRRLAFHPDVLAGAQQRCLSREGVSYQFDGDSLLQWAEDYWICCWMGRSAKAGTDDEFKGGLSVRWTASGGDSAIRFSNSVRGIRQWRKILARCNFTTEDVFDFLGKVKDKEGHGLYLDTPFPGPGDAYKHKFGEEQQRVLAARLRAFRHVRIANRYYDVPLVRELYPEPDWEWQILEGRKQSNAPGPEVLICRGTK